MNHLNRNVTYKYQALLCKFESTNICRLNINKLMDEVISCLLN